MSGKWCCASMQRAAVLNCAQHTDPFDCSDVLIHQRTDGLYGIVIHDGGSSVSIIRYCPWCGTDLGASDDAGVRMIEI